MMGGKKTLAAVPEPPGLMDYLEDFELRQIIVAILVRKVTDELHGTTHENELHGTTHEIYGTIDAQIYGTIDAQIYGTIDAQTTTLSALKDYVHIDWSPLLQLLNLRRVNQAFHEDVTICFVGKLRQRLADYHPHLHYSNYSKMETYRINIYAKQLGTNAYIDLASALLSGAFARCEEFVLYDSKLSLRSCFALLFFAIIGTWRNCRLGFPGLAQCKMLQLRGNEIGDLGIVPLSTALGGGALAQLRSLHLQYNEISDLGMTRLADACTEGALRVLTTLALDCNRIGDAGLAALAGARCEGTPVLAQLTWLRLTTNRIGDKGVEAFAKECASGAFPRLRDLDLDWNDIGDTGIASLADACARWALPFVDDTRLNVAHNRCSPEAVEALGEAMTERKSHQNTKPSWLTSLESEASQVY